MIQLSSNIANYISEHFGEDFLRDYSQYYSGEYRPYLRVSPFADKDTLLESLKRYNIVLEAVPGVYNAFQILSGGEIAGKTLEFILGKYYIQSLSSMIPPLVLNPAAGDAVLDLCAAPGSKTTQLAELMKNSGTLIANEISTERLKSLVFNVDKMSLVNVGILHGKGELLSRQFENRFDKILVDAPCSALGITQKKGEVSNWWDIKKAEALSDQQLRLLVAAIKMCKVGGEIVYSTCTLTLEENELIIDKILKKYPVELAPVSLPVKSRSGFTEYGNRPLNPELAKTHRIIPWEIHSEGFFVAKLIKTDYADEVENKLRPEKKYELIKSNSGKIKNYLSGLADYYGIEKTVFDSYKYLIKNSDVHFVNENWYSSFLESFNRVGTRLGTIDKKNILQLNPLAAQILGNYAVKNIIRLESVAELEIYFNGGTIKKNIDHGGQKIVKYEDYILGTAVVSKEGIKSQFPRAFRTQEIKLS